MRNELILVVDDHEDSRTVHWMLLQQGGFQVAEARDGLEAIEQALALSPAVILLDLYMPRMSGFEAAWRIKTDKRTRDIPIIALTAGGEEEKALRGGCDFFLRKPVQPEQLLHKVRRALAR